MSEKIYNQQILIIDQATNGIICTAYSDPHASAILMGLINGKSMAFGKFFGKFFYNEDALQQSSFNFNDGNRHYQLTSNFGVTLLPEKFITPKWIKLRKITLYKVNHLSFWEFRIRQHLNRVNDFYGLPNMMPFLTEQLALCNPQKDYYTRAINEWADIQEILPNAAYQELKIRQEGYGLVYIRSHALYLKHAKKISEATSIEEIDYKLDLACHELMEKNKL